MRVLKATVIIASLILISGCDKSNEESMGGKGVTQQFLTEYNGTYVETTNRTDGGEVISISRDGEIEIQKIRNVGQANNPAIPAGTICNYVLHGQVRSIIELNEEARKLVDENDNVYSMPQTHNLTFSVLQVSLSNTLHAGTTEDPACLNFQEEMNQRLPMYTYGLELFPGGHIRLHTTNNDDITFEERGPGTLDENFTRQ